MSEFEKCFIMLCTSATEKECPVVDLETAQKYYLRLGGGLLLYGPPGTGENSCGSSYCRRDRCAIR